MATPSADRLTDRDLEVLGDLEAACRSILKFGREWVTPQDCGGYNGSDHSYRLSKLARVGLVDTKRPGGWSRGSKHYRINGTGKARLDG